jgi:hypothetical protein
MQIKPLALSPLFITLQAEPAETEGAAEAANAGINNEPAIAPTTSL